MNPVNLAANMGAVTTWWASLSPQARRGCYRPHEIANATGVAVNSLSTVLQLLKWQRARRWVRVNNRRVLRVYYAPPGHRVPHPPRGRPPLDLIAVLAHDTPRTPCGPLPR